MSPAQVTRRPGAPDGLRVEKNGDVTTLALARPECGNALSAGLVAALADAVQTCYRDGTRLLAFAGSGPHFCTGFDLGNLESESDDSLLARFIRVELLLQAVHAAPFTTVALVRGRAVGAGADLVAACEQRWMDRHSSIAFPGAGFGLVLGSARLAGLVGTALAREWISGGAAIGADAAAAAGFAGLVAQQDQPAALAALAARTRRLDRSAHAAIQAATLQGHGAIAQAQASQLADLARSAARPGLKARIVAYRASLKR